MARVRYLQALNKALHDEMERDPAVFVIGEDVRASLRGVTTGLAERFGDERVIDTPISEAAFTGFATGAALSGYRPVVEYQIPSLLYVAFEQITNQAQKLRLMTGGQAKVPVTYVVPGSGARVGLAGQHSDHPYPQLLHMGVKTVIPASADDAYGLFVSAIRDDDPVVLFAPAAALPRRDELADEPDEIPLGKGRIRRPGDDVTVITLGHLVREAESVAEELEAEGISVEVFDPRTLLPLDRELLASSVAKTGRVVIYDDSNRTCGFAAELAAIVGEEYWDSLQAPVKRVTRADAPIAFAPPLERWALPSPDRLATAVRAVAPHKEIAG